MVKNYKWSLLLCVLLALPLTAFALGANSVSIEADQYVTVGEPIEVSVLVTHEKSSKVDEGSFTMDGKRLQVSFAKEIKMSPNSNLVISVYKFKIPPKKSGSYTIPSISVDVGGETLTSYEGSYEVQ